jgi:hypothetical protein
MDFWTEILDLEWHEVDSSDCSIQRWTERPAFLIPPPQPRGPSFRTGPLSRAGSPLIPFQSWPNTRCSWFQYMKSAIF